MIIARELVVEVVIPLSERYYSGEKISTRYPAIIKGCSPIQCANEFTQNLACCTKQALRMAAYTSPPHQSPHPNPAKHIGNIQAAMRSIFP
jgi:hypothetical protein